MQARQRALTIAILFAIALPCATVQGQRRIQRNARRHVPQHTRVAQGSGTRISPGTVSTPMAAPQAAANMVQNGVQEIISQPVPSGTVHGQVMGSTISNGGGEIISDPVIHGQPVAMPADGGVIVHPSGSSMNETIIEGQPILSHGGMACEGDGCSGCADCGAGGQHYRGLVQQGLGLDNLSFFGGVQGFKNQSNRGADASFGFREGVNFGTYGRNIVLPSTVGAQVGFAATQSNLSGASQTDTQRNQMFVTAGVFRRADIGLQGGIVFDYLNDDWYFDDLGVGQIRGELSMALSNRGSYGFWFTNSVREQTQESVLFSGTVTETWETVDLYAIFFRSRMIANGAGEVRLYAGWTGDSDGLVGAESKIPLQNGWALESEFTYLIPDEEANNGGAENEAWNIGINLVWYPGSLRYNGVRYHRPLFDVANNGNMMLRRKN